MTKTLKPMRIYVVGDCPLDDGALHCRVVQAMNQLSAGGARPLTIIHDGSRPGGSAGIWAYSTRTPYEVYPGSAAECFGRGKPDVMLKFGPTTIVAPANVRVVEAP